MDTLTHANCITYLSSKKFETLELQTEQLSSAKYVIENMPASALTFSDDNKKGLSLPSINRYIADDFTLKDGEEKNWEYPQKIEETENGELWLVCYALTFCIKEFVAIYELKHCVVI